MTNGTDDIPAAPWRLRGNASLHLQTIAASRARAVVPQRLSIVQVLPGQTLGGIYLATYTDGSTLRYNELIAVAALVRYRRWIGTWISHIYVDDEVSMAAGRRIWGLPKQMAQFQRQGDGRIIVRQQQLELCTLHPGTPNRLPGRLPLLAPVLAEREERIVWFHARGTARWGLGRSKIEMPADSPLAMLGFGHGRAISLEDMSVTVRAPE